MSLPADGSQMRTATDAVPPAFGRVRRFVHSPRLPHGLALVTGATVVLVHALPFSDAGLTALDGALIVCLLAALVLAVRVIDSVMLAVRRGTVESREAPP